MPSVEEIRWTNPSVHALAGEGGPVESILGRVRHQVFAAMERGWSGPPYDPLELAELSGVEVIPIEEVEDARLVHHKGRPRIEFNANRSPERVRFSVAHELGHLAFPDAAEKIRYRTHSVGAEADAWQIELLCNLAAAELLMPTGSFPELADEITLEHLIHLGSEFFVSVEAVVLRAVRLASQPACVFAAARVDEGHRNTPCRNGTRRIHSRYDRVFSRTLRALPAVTSAPLSVFGVPWPRGWARFKILTLKQFIEGIIIVPEKYGPTHE